MCRMQPLKVDTGRPSTGWKCCCSPLIWVHSCPGTGGGGDRWPGLSPPLPGAGESPLGGGGSIRSLCLQPEGWTSMKLGAQERREMECVRPN